MKGATYLAVNIIRCQGLKPGDEDGTADPYVSVTWDQTSQQTRVLRNTRNPLYEETLYFPVKLVRITKEGMEKKGDLTIFVLDYDPNGADNLGFYQLGLDQVTNSPYRRLGDLKTRVFEHEALPLSQPGVKQTTGTLHIQVRGRHTCPIPTSLSLALPLTPHPHPHPHPRPHPTGAKHIQAYFTPDLPDEVHLEAKKSGPTLLGDAFARREKQWRLGVPQRLASRGKYLVTACDETNTVRFLPTYLCKCPPPKDVSDPMTIARMVHCITFQTDPHVADAKKGGSDGVMELWSSPNYFMDVKKGASEDHAILQCNLFLGMGLDAYIAIGRLPGGIVQHVWVMTREPNGDVRFWETTKGRFFTLPQRWAGLLMDGADAGVFKEHQDRLHPTAQARARDPSQHKRAKQKGGGGAEGDPRKARAAAALAQDKAAREAAANKVLLEKKQKKERALLYLDQQEMWTVEAERNPFETPREMPDGTGAALLHKPDGASPDVPRVKVGLKGAAKNILTKGKVRCLSTPGRHLSSPMPHPVVLAQSSCLI